MHVVSVGCLGQADLGVAMDVARPEGKDAKRVAANITVTIRGMEENVLRAKPFIDALAKGSSVADNTMPLPPCIVVH